MIKNLQKIIIGLFLTLAVSSVAQTNLNPERCLSEAVHQRLLQTDPEYATNILANEAKIQNVINYGTPKSGDTYVIPVVVHVMHLGEAEGTGTNISTAQIQSAIDNLNTCFGGGGAYPLNIDVQFQLAVRDPNCNSTTGIVRVDASGTSNYATHGIQNDGTDTIIRFLSLWPSNDYYNIWIVNEINNNDGGSGTQGFAYYPGGGPKYDGAVILYNAFGYDPTNTLGYTLKSYTTYNVTAHHELGHAFNLKHTFHGDDANNDGTADQCPVNTTCTTDGDLCCDTEAHRRDDGNCGATGNSCTGQSLVNVVQNIMAYSSDNCQIMFTPDQKTRMRAAISTLRASLLTSPGLVPISGATPSSSLSCSPQTTNLSNSFGMGVFSLTIENTSYTSGGAVTDGGFKTKWCNNFNLNTNTLYSISVKTGNSNQEKIKVYIDYNNDGDFTDTGEEIFANNTGGLTHSGSFTSATAPVTGQSLWLRVVSDFFGNTITGPCYQPLYGQVEDFSVIIAAACTPPSAPTGLATQSFCSGASPTVANLAATGTTIQWYAASTGGTAKLSTEALVTGTHYWASQTIGGCESSTRFEVIATINATPGAPTGTASQSFCSSSSPTVADLVVTGTAIQWYVASTGGTAKLSTEALITGTHYWASQTIDGCESSARFEVIATINTSPTAPTVGTITQPTCTVATGDVVLNDLPTNGTWTLTVTPGGTTTTGTGTSSTINGLSMGTYTYTVTNASACISPSSANVIINTQPNTPTAPTVGTITQPTCSVATGDVVLNDLPATGTWTLTVTPGGTTTTGTGTSTTITGLSAGTYSYTVTNASNCTSVASASITINAQQTAPTIGTITQPTCAVPTGEVMLNDLPAIGSWTLTVTPGGTTTTGTGTSTTITGLGAGTYSYTVTNASNCTSSPSANVVINAPTAPVAPTIGTITQPTCTIATGDVILNDLPPTGTWTLTVTPSGTTTTGTSTSTTITGLGAGTYSYTVTNALACTSSSSANIVINTQPITPPAPTVGTITQPTCSVATGDVVLNDLPATGTWTLTVTPGGTTTTGTGTSSTLTTLTPGTYTCTVTNASACTSVASTAFVINVQPTLTVNSIANNSVCNGDTIATTSFSSTPSGATYDWVNSDNTIGLALTGAGDIAEFTALNSTNSSVTATITVTPTLNGCIGTPSSFTITVEPTPLITVNGTTLTAPASSSYQWYLDGQIIGGATNQSYTITQNGDFSVIINGNTCASDNINFNSTDINKLNNNYFLSVYPNPTNGNCNITFTGTTKTTYELTLQNASGALVYQEILTDFNGNYSKQIDLTKQGKGIYLISVSSPNGEVIKKVVVY
jgi:hypothetical protein